ncbi:hypothetical protein AB0I77_06200 [Streptomyces sp. NPDC050619]|uniref:hypothetical protein n=1 Tax=Streptomyces sp. NPDC050619 TaxID=3157214 RepID=UPI0034463EAD
MSPAGRSQRDHPGFDCPVPLHHGLCALQGVAMHASTDSIEAIGSAVVVHGTISEEDLTSIEDSHPGRHVVLDGDTLVLWPADKPTG